MGSSQIANATPQESSQQKKIGFVVEGLHGQTSIADLCGKEGIAHNLFNCWNKDFLESGKKRLDRATIPEANITEVQFLQ